ncbi:MAG: ribosome maturation factor RimM [Saprospiraceae bacterium]
MEEYIVIGHTKKTHGARGGLKVSIKDFYLQDFLETEVVFLALSGKPVPFFVESITGRETLILKLEDINSPTDAKLLTSKEIQLRRSDLVPDEERIIEEGEAPFEKYTGYLARDLKAGEIGAIAEIVELPQQIMALVRRNDGKETLIPLHDSLIHHVDTAARVITFHLPDGLLDL